MPHSWAALHTLMDGVLCCGHRCLRGLWGDLDSRQLFWMHGLLGSSLVKPAVPTTPGLSCAYVGTEDFGWAALMFLLGLKVGDT